MSEALRLLEAVPCPLRGGRTATALRTERDRALGVPGRFHVARRCADATAGARA